MEISLGGSCRFALICWGWAEYVGTKVVPANAGFSFNGEALVRRDFPPRLPVAHNVLGGSDGRC